MKTKTTIHKHGFGTAPGRRGGFTLIELLALLLLLALMSSLLLPALAKSQREPRWTVCRNNLRQMGTAVSLYAAENRDYLAFPNWDGGFGQMVPGWLYTVTNGAIPDAGPGGPYADNPRVAYATGLWFQYIRAPRSYLCPAGRNSFSYSQPRLRNNRLSTYSMNGAVCGYELSSTTCRITAVWNSSAYLLWEPDENALAPGVPGPFVFNDGAVFPSNGEGIGKLHSLAGAEVLCVNGTVQFVPLQLFNREANASGRSLAWWSPFNSSGH